MQNAWTRDVTFGLSIVLAAGLAVVGGAALAQPAEAPPPTTTGTYVDSTGCAWQSVAFGDQVAWAALMRADGTQMCDMVPSVPRDVVEATPPAEEVTPPAVTAEGEVEAAPTETAEAEAVTPAEEVAETPAEDPAEAVAEAEPEVAVAPADPETAAVEEPKPVATAALAPAPVVQTKPAKVARKTMRRPDFPLPGYYLQVGAFKEPVNADRAVTFMQGLGYGALRQSSKAAKPLQIIYAGPFQDRLTADSARAMVGKVGYGDAFVWDAE